MSQQQFNNLDLLADVRAILNNNALDAETRLQIVERVSALQVQPFFIPMTGVTDSVFTLFGEIKVVAANLTADYLTKFAANNQHVSITVNTITGSGDITISGDKIDEVTGGISLGVTEIITVDSTPGQAYQTLGKFQTVDSITLGGGISAINYNVMNLGYYDGANQDFWVGGYRADIKVASNTSDLKVRIRKVQNDGGNKYSIVEIEDLGFDSTNTNGQIYDNIRTGPEERSYTMSSVPLVPSGSVQTFKQSDFNTYFTSNENKILGSNDEGIIVSFEGSPTGGLSSISHVTMFLALQAIVSP
jgi:hypothetical protein